jgi:hypothetical protein
MSDQFLHVVVVANFDVRLSLCLPIMLPCPANLVIDDLGWSSTFSGLQNFVYLSLTPYGEMVIESDVCVLADSLLSIVFPDIACMCTAAMMADHLIHQNRTSDP